MALATATRGLDGAIFYRAYLYEEGVRTHLWIVYIIDEDRKTVSVLRVWNVARNTKQFGV